VQRGYVGYFKIRAMGLCTILKFWHKWKMRFLKNIIFGPKLAIVVD
jgi:hypothetical protein